VKDQESNPRPHTPRPAALPVKVQQWVRRKKREGGGVSPEVLPTEIQDDGPVRDRGGELQEGDDDLHEAVHYGGRLPVLVLQHRPVGVVDTEQDCKGVHQRQPACVRHKS